MANLLDRVLGAGSGYGESETLYPEEMERQKKDLEDYYRDVREWNAYQDALDEIGESNRAMSEFETYAPSPSKGKYRMTVDANPDYRAIWEEEQRRRDMGEITPLESQSRAEAFLFGYDPNYGFEEDEIPFGAYFIPVVGQGLYAYDKARQVARGGTLGAADIPFLVAPFARGAGRAGKAFVSGYRQGKARRAAEQAARSRAIEGPRTRRFNANTRTWDEYYEPEFTPYEEVR